MTKTIAMILVTAAIIALALGITHQAYSQSGPPATEGKPLTDGIDANLKGMERVQPNTPPGDIQTVIVAGNLNGGGGHVVVVQGVPPSPSGITSEVTKCVGSTAFQQTFDEPTGQPNACTK